MKKLLLLLAALAAMADEVTIYKGFAFIKETRSVRDHIIAPLPKSIVPDSIYASGAKGYYRYKPAGFDRHALLRSFLHKRVRFDRGTEVLEGELISIDPIIIQTSKRVYFDVAFRDIHIPNVQIPTAPSLYLEEPQNGKTELMYLVEGINWKANYTARIGKRLDLRGTIKIEDRSGYRYNLVKLGVVAGDVRRKKSVRRPPIMMKAMVAEAAPDQIAPKSVTGLYRYDIPGRWNLQDGLYVPFVELDIPYELRYRADLSGVGYHRGTLRQKFRRILTFRSPKPLPQGTVRIYSADTFLAEAHISDVAPKEQVRLELGKDFDLSIKRVTKEYENSKTFFRSRVRYEVQNPKAKEVEVRIYEHLPWSDMHITSERSYRTVDASTILYVLKLPAKSARAFEVTYSYRKK